MTPVWKETDMNAQRRFFHFHPGPGTQIYRPDSGDFVHSEGEFMNAIK